MAKNEIKSKLILEGESEYRKQLTDAANALKVLDSEQKLAKAQFEATGDAQQYAADKARILKEQIKEQEKAVQAAQSAINILTTKGVDKNNKSMQTWTTRLNTAKTRLTTLQTQLDNTEGELREQGQAFDDTTQDAGEYKDQLESIDKNVKFQNTIAAIDNIREHIEAVIRAGAKAVKTVWDWEIGASKWADDLATAASQAGIDVETYQSWQYASLFIDTEVDKIISARTKLTQKLASTSEEDAKAFNELNIRTRNADGSIRDATDVMWDAVDALGRYTDMTQREAHAQKIFGQSWKELQPLIEAGSAAYKKRAEEGLRDATVSEEQVTALGDLNDSYNALNAVWEKTKYSLLAQLTPAFKEAADAMTEALKQFNAFLETDEGKAALEELSSALTGVVTSITDHDFSGVLDTAKKAVQGLTSALSWISENGGVVVAAVGSLAAAWTGLTVSKEVLQVLLLLRTINWSKIGSIGGGAASGAASAAGAAGAGVPSAIEALRNGARATGNVALHAASKAETIALAEMAAEAAVNMVKEVKEQGTLLGIGQRDLEGAIDIGGIKIGGSMEGTTSLWDALKTTFGSNGSTSTQKDAMGVPLDELAAYQAAMEEAGQAAQQMGEDVSKGAEDVSQAVTEMGETVTQELEEEMSWFDVIGQNAGQGLANGITDKIPAAVAAAQAMAQAVTDTLTAALQIASPSKVMKKLGGFVTEGFAEGIDSQISRVDRAVGRMVDSTTRAPARSSGSAGAYAGGGNMQAVIVMDKKIVGQLTAPIVDGYIGAQLAAAR